MAATTYIEGLDELKAALKDCGKVVTKSIRARLKPAAEIVAVEQRARAPVLTGNLQRGIKSFAQPARLSVSIKSTARSKASGETYQRRGKTRAKKGYPYGKALEFNPKYGGRYAHFYSGFDAKKEAAIAKLREILDDIAREFVK